MFLIIEKRGGSFEGINLANVLSVDYNPKAPIDIDVENSPTEPSLYIYFTHDVREPRRVFRGIKAEAMWQAIRDEFGYVSYIQGERLDDE